MDATCTKREEMKRIILCLDKIPLMKKIVLIYVGTVLFPLFMIVLYFSQSEYGHLYMEAVNGRKQALEQLAQSIKTSIAGIEDLSQSLAYRSPMVELISRENLDNFPIWTKKTMEESMEALRYTLKYQNSGIKDIVVYTNRQELCDDTKFFLESRLYGQTFYSDFRKLQKNADFYLLEGEDAAGYYEQKGNGSGSEILLFVREIQSEAEDTYSGILICEIDPALFFSSFSLNIQNLRDYMIYFSNMKNVLGSEPSEQLFEEIQTYPLQNITEHAEEIAGYLCVNTGDYNIILGDMKGISKNRLFHPVLMILLIFVFLTLIQVVILRLLIKNIRRNLDRNINEMEQIIVNGFNDQIHVDANDEFRDITIRYNVLLDKARKLVSEMLQKERESRAAQIKALQYQLNPHFIYNTLSIFASNAEESKNYRLADAISYFGHLLRYNIKNAELFASLQEELDNAYYLTKVYSLRFRESLELNIEIPEDAYKMKIIKYLLQPLLENAILHGSSHGKRKLTVFIKARISEGMIVIKLEDNGVGIEQEHLKKIQINIKEGTVLEGSSARSSFIGLRNVYKRLKLIYGERADLTIDSVFGEGTSVTAVVPLEKSELEK